MRCQHFREYVLDVIQARSSEVEEHLLSCAACAAYARQWSSLRTGLRRVAEEIAPEPSLGFAMRAARRSQDASNATGAGETSLVRAGRRFVYAALMAAALLVLGLLVPPSGPLRAHATASIEPAQPETVAAQNYPIFSGQLMDNDPEFAPSPERR